MVRDNFFQRKKSVLSKKDKSSIGNWDEKIVKLCEKINESENYYTTSSCAGRIVLIIDSKKKGKGLFKFVSHDEVGLEEFKAELNKLGSQARDDKKLLNEKNYDNSVVVEKSVEDDFEVSDGRAKRGSLIIFKQEPPILHVACKDLEDAERLLKIVRDVGLKRAGIISLGNNIMVEIIGTEKLEFPIISEEELLVSDEFLEVVLGRANGNLEKGWEKLKKLTSLFSMEKIK